MQNHEECATCGRSQDESIMLFGSFMIRNTGSLCLPCFSREFLIQIESDSSGVVDELLKIVEIDTSFNKKK